MTKITYVVVEHDGGWAYKLNDVFSEAFASKAEAVAAAKRAAFEQQLEDPNSVAISWEDEKGIWHDELSRGDDRPQTDVVA